MHKGFGSFFGVSLYPAMLLRVPLLVVLCLITTIAIAGDPLFRGPDGAGVGWPRDEPVRAWLFDGDLPAVTRERIHLEVGTALEMWGAIPDSRIDLRFQGILSGPLTRDNFLESVFTNPDDVGDSPPRRVGIVIVPDRDGAILDSIGKGYGATVNGLTWSFNEAESTGTLYCAIVLLNGKKITAEGFANTLRHELGHALGLAHMESNVDCGQLIIPMNESGCEDRPLLRRGMHAGAGTDLTLDDIATFRSLYPVPATSASWGRIDGRLRLRSSGRTVPGAVVVARDAASPRKQAVSSVTARDTKRSGRFEINGLPSGSYRLEVAPIVADVGVSDTLGDISSPFPKLSYPSRFLAIIDGREVPLDEARFRVSAGERYSVEVIQDDLHPIEAIEPSIASAAAMVRGDTLSVSIEIDNPNGEPVAVWEKRLDSAGTDINPGVWLWDQTNSLGITHPFLHLTMEPEAAVRVGETRKVRLYAGGTRWYGALDPALPGVSADQIMEVPVEVEPTLGDADGDGSLTVRDVVLSLRHAVGVESLAPPARLRTDVAPVPGAGGRIQGDGVVDIVDAVSQLRRLVGLEIEPVPPIRARMQSVTGYRRAPDPERRFEVNRNAPSIPSRYQGGILIP